MLIANSAVYPSVSNYEGFSYLEGGGQHDMLCRRVTACVFVTPPLSDGRLGMHTRAVIRKPIFERDKGTRERRTESNLPNLPRLGIAIEVQMTTLMSLLSCDLRLL